MRCRTLKETIYFYPSPSHPSCSSQTFDPHTFLSLLLFRVFNPSYTPSFSLCLTFYIFFPTQDACLQQKWALDTVLNLERPHVFAVPIQPPCSYDVGSNKHRIILTRTNVTSLYEISILGTCCMRFSFLQLIRQGFERQDYVMSDARKIEE